MINIIFDQYQRYKNAQKIVNSIRKDNQKLKILEVGANEHKNLEKFLPNDEVTYLDISLPDNLINDPQYILGDATNMSFKDNTYDIVIALDVYEHIPKDRREAFITEVYRVCSKLAIISAPFNKEEVELAESRANVYYKSLIGVNHLWIYEHISYGLPNIEQVKSFLSKNSIKFSSFSHGNLEMWEKLTNIQALIQLDPGVEEYVIEIDKYYNCCLFDLDYCDDGYRNFFILEKNDEMKMEISKKDYDKSMINSLIDNLYKIYETRINLGVKKTELPLFGFNVIKAYIDYGRGYNEVDSKRVNVNVEIGDHIVFENFADEKISSIRIDPTEKEGNFAFTDLVIKNNKNQVIDWEIQSNCSINRGNEYLFFKKDPQIIIKINNEIVSSVEFNIKRLKNYEEISEAAIEIIDSLSNKLNKLEEQNNILIHSTEGIITKVKRKMNS